METIADRLAAQVAAACQKRSYAFFQQGEYNLNLIGIRSPSTRAGAFDDTFLCLYRERGSWRAHVWPITTDPGRRYLRRPINAEGCAILAHPQQCRGAYRIGLHRGHRALVQHGASVRVWRDGDKDDELDLEGIERRGWYGINIHRAAVQGISDTTDSYSAGCQVFAVTNEHEALMDLCRKSAERYGDRFTYTLLAAGDLD